MKRLNDSPLERLAQCRGEAVPPAGDVEVQPHGWLVGSRFYALREEAIEAAGKTAVIDVFKRSQITRLTAERDGVQALYEDTQTRLIASMKDAKALETELTKAQKLLDGVVESYRTYEKRGAECDFECQPMIYASVLEHHAELILAHQSAPAVKG